MPEHLPSKIGIYDAPLFEHRRLVGDIYLMRMDCPPIADSAHPGQFINIKVNNELIPLLRKPFSICRLDSEAGWIEVLWKIVGKGTQIMADYSVGETVNILGPLGRGFEIPPDLNRAFLVGGGLGVAPLPFLCQRLTDAGIPTEVFLGARSKNELSFVKEFREMGVTVLATTEDGSFGQTGLVTDLVVARIEEGRLSRREHIYSCGPTAFLNAMIDITKQHQIEGQVSLETMMGCGFGICVGCPVEVVNPRSEGQRYRLTCLDGPVFDAREVKLYD